MVKKLPFPKKDSLEPQNYSFELGNGGYSLSKGYIILMNSFGQQA